ncbi:MAG: 2-isopropylmalate synthase [Oscillospiraceae bacterium]|nr:2-isopropylmalate synthase [Oscillospiraceae bacterium]
MNNGFNKYVPFKQIDLRNREWPSKVIDKAPIWCSVDLRDGNQALVDPMNMDEKLQYFKALCDMGFKEIEIGFPSASETEYEICRELIVGGHIPDGVWIQVLVQAREHLIKKTFEAIKGAKNVIVHFYNSTSVLQRKVVFNMDKQGITDIAVEGAKLIRELTEQQCEEGQNIRFEYSPESFSGTEVDFSVDICEKVLDELHATAENPVILNLPNTVEMCTPNTYADQIEYFIKHIKGRERAIISVHPHNDRGSGVACAELAMLAGADRVEGTLFGNGERTGNLDIVTTGLNMYTQGVDPKLDFSDLPQLREMFESCTKMHVHERHPYTGELVFTAFSGSHQDAINKGMQYMQKNNSEVWEIPYLPIDPADVGRQYEPIIRINSQSGKGGAAFIMQYKFGYSLPKAMQPEFGSMVKKQCDELGRELSTDELLDVFKNGYINIPEKYKLIKVRFDEQSSNDNSDVHFKGVIESEGNQKSLDGVGNGPIDAFFNAIKKLNINDFKFVTYNEHAISSGSDSKAVAYIQLTAPDGKPAFGVGIANNINLASIKGVLSAINRASL